MDANKSDDSVLQDAIVFAVSAFQQSQKKKKKPVIFHSLRIGFWLYEQGYNQEVVAGAFLHDVVETYQTNLLLIKDRFGGRVAKIVDALTVNESIKDPLTRYRDSIERCLDVGEEALVIRAGDLLENINRAIESKQINKLELQYKKIDLLVNALAEHHFDVSIKLRLEQVRRRISGVLGHRS